MFIDQFSHILGQIFMPARCLFCGNSTGNSFSICTACYQDMPILTHVCQQCAEILSADDSDNSRICGICMRTPPPFDRMFALFAYRFPIISFIAQFKFQHQLQHAEALAKLFVQSISQHWYENKPLPDLIIPVPLHHKRLQQRGFNQALQIAKPISKLLKIPVDSTGIRRIKNTVPQSQLSQEARVANIANAFIALRSYTGMKIAIIDDVITTGQTITQCCLVLKQQGAESVDVWCCARNQKMYCGY